MLWVGGRLVVSGELTSGQLVAFLLYTLMIATPIGAFTTLYAQFQQAIGASDRVFELLGTPSEMADDADAQPLPPIEGLVRFDSVTFDYQDHSEARTVLREVNLTARPGQVIALVGPSGAGKTTLVNLIARFYDPTEGSITIDCCDIRDVQMRSLREQIGIVPQETALFGGNVRDNIRYGKLDATQAEIEAAAQAANAHDFISAMAKGYDTLVGERGVKLSGGQRQRIAIARAILKNPRILILDEATSALDTESEQAVQEALDRLIRDRTTFVIAHRLSTITNADVIAVLEGGKIVEQGTHAELLARENGLYRRMYGLQFRWEEEPAAAPSANVAAETEAKPARSGFGVRLSLPFFRRPARRGGNDECSRSTAARHIMSWSLRVLRVNGIPIRIHFTFLLVVAWAAYIGFEDGGANWLQSVGFMVAFVLLLFLCVMLHELGHSLVAQLFGVKVVDITLLPIGGLARMTKMPDRPYQEFVMAAAGPATNIALAVALSVSRWRGSARSKSFSLALSPELLDTFLSGTGGQTLLALLILNNILLAVFNLIPAFPLDGGRMLPIVPGRADFPPPGDVHRLIRRPDAHARVGHGCALQQRLLPGPDRCVHVHGRVARAGTAPPTDQPAGCASARRCSRSDCACIRCKVLAKWRRKRPHCPKPRFSCSTADGLPGF